MDGHDRGGGVEVFVADLADILAVNGVGVGCAEALYIKQACALADLLIRGKADAELSVGAVFSDDALKRGHNFGNTGLVICTQQRGAIGRD